MSRSFLRFATGHDAQAFISTQPLSALAPLLCAIFTLFSIMGFLTDVMVGGRQPWQLLAANVLFSGTIAIGYAFAGLAAVWRHGNRRAPTSRYRLPRRWAALAIPVMIGLHVLYATTITKWFPAESAITPAEAAARLRFDAIGIAVCMAVSYALFLTFIGGTGRKLLAARAELRLAAEIHAVLVPAITQRIGAFEFHGLSQASGDVGGDLVDVVRAAAAGPADGHDGQSWIGYVADVSGHGVSSGLLMGMTKSAAHMKLRTGSALAPLLDDLNAVLYHLKGPSMYLTFAGIAHRNGTLEFAVAGHLPILHVSAHGIVSEATTPQLPLGFFEDTRFTSARLTCEPGDLLALVTDGLTEVFDRSDREFGLERVKEYLRGHAHLPLDAVARGLVELVRAHGDQLDDQTLLLIRRDRR